MQARSPWGRVLVGGQDGSEGPRAHLWVSRRGKRGVAETSVLGGAPAPALITVMASISRSINKVHLHFQACITRQAGNTCSLCSKIKMTVVPVSLGGGGLRPKEAGQGDQGHRATV